jgi:hypothetical protein
MVSLHVSNMPEEHAGEGGVENFVICNRMELSPTSDGKRTGEEENLNI